MTVEARFWGKAHVTDSCWLWTGALDPKGYGRFSVATGRQLLAHRASWEMFRGPIPDGLCVLHRCDVPACVNPDHLFLGTVLDNNRDMAAKGRQQRGTRHYAARFSAEDVRHLRHEHMATGIGYRRLARRLGVPSKTMQDLLRGKTYREVVQ